jgi:hypothetical protein
MNTSRWFRKQIVDRVLLASLVMASSPAWGDVPVIGKLFSKSPHADPQGDLQLKEEHGPWMIMAASFGGEEGAAQAEQLARELRRDLHLPAFVYSSEYDYTAPQRTAIPGKSARYANSTKYEATVVLVGEYAHPEDDRARGTLDRIKTLKPSALDYSKTGKTAQRFAILRAYAQKIAPDGKQKGPMASAFVTRNPLLPEDYFESSPVVDNFVRSLNSPVEHSLLKCKGKFTVLVASFDGASAVDFGKNDRGAELVPTTDRLEIAADKAHRLTTWLRREKVEAYEFHDRYRSIVTVGSFEQIGTTNADGKFVHDPVIFDTMQKFSATHGMKVLDKGLHVNGRGDIPFEFNPYPIAVPRTDKSGIYKGNWLSSK